LAVLPNRLKVGRNLPGPWQLGRNGHDAALIRACAWVSESECLPKGRTGEIEIYPLSKAIADNHVVVVKNLKWKSKKTGSDHIGTAFVPRRFFNAHEIDRLIVIAVEADDWHHGRIELQKVPDGRNEHVLVTLPFKKQVFVNWSTPALKFVELL
jgi:hypothetical protein